MGRSPCCDKSNGLKKGPWTQEEDQILVDYITKNGYGNWRTLPKNAGLQRCGKSCRLRWTNYLRPDIKRGRFSSEEEEAIIHLHSILGNKWSAIASRLPGRTDNEIKNYWNTHIRKRLLRMGIDPVTHCPRLDLLDLSSILNSSYYGNGGLDGCSPDVNFTRCFRGIGDYNRVINPDLLKLATSLFSSQRHENLNLTQPCDGQVQVQGHTLAQSQFGCNQELIQFSQGLAQLEQMNDDWESRSGLYTTSLDEDYPQIDFPSYVYNDSLDDPALLEENIPTLINSYYGNHFVSSCSPTPMNSNSNSTTTYINSSVNEDEREISYCSGNDTVARFEMVPVDGAFDTMLLGGSFE